MSAQVERSDSRALSHPFRFATGRGQVSESDSGTIEAVQVFDVPGSLLNPQTSSVISRQPSRVPWQHWIHERTACQSSSAPLCSTDKVKGYLYWFGEGLSELGKAQTADQRIWPRFSSTCSRDCLTHQSRLPASL